MAKKNKPAADMNFDQAKRLCEAVIFASTQPVKNEVLEERIGAADLVSAVMGQLREDYRGRGIELVQTAGGWMFRSAPDLASTLNVTVQVRRKLPRVAAETLSIIAYHQPVTRAEVESIRGVATARETLDALMELGWVRPGKRRETPGRPLTWITTDEFLRHFGLASLKDLPGVQELREAGLLDSRPVLAGFTSDDAENAAATPEDGEEERLEYLPDTLEDEESAAKAG
ncbi:MAG TPA: SMC-Scp complex subunit ScpB [Alphaproteobacteria bacterium]|nr:SMC-Scp complex subunit ScpB [Alphaproteobacteria bacterium]